jgi:hypothetical protein
VQASVAEGGDDRTGSFFLNNGFLSHDKKFNG